MRNTTRMWAKGLVCAQLLFSCVAFSQQNTPQQAAEVVSDMNQQLADSQQTIDELSLATRKMLQQYREILQKKDYQQYYNFQLKQLQSAQQQEIAQLQQRLQELELIEVAMMPLMQSMLSALEEFIALDMPFQLQTRMAGLQTLRNRINSASLALPDKYRLLMEAWQIEYDYGRSAETWRGDLRDDSGNSKLAVNYLRVGRVAWYYQTLDEKQQAIWNKASRSWQTLPAEFAADLKRSMQVVSKQIAPELLPLPLPTKMLQTVEAGK